MPRPSLGGVERRDAAAAAPALMAEPEAFEQIDRFPIEDRLAQPERGDRPRVEPGPRQERDAPAERPDLDPGGRPDAQAPCMKPQSVGDDQPICGVPDSLRGAQAALPCRFPRER